MIQASHRFGLLLRRQICLNPSWLGGLVYVFASAQQSTDRARYARPHSLPGKLSSDKFANSAADQTSWLDCIMKCDGEHHFDTSVWLNDYRELV